MARGTCEFCGKSVAFDYCETCLRAWMSVKAISPAVLEKIIRFVHMEKFVKEKKR